jgi:hypothetical protein
MAQAQTKSPTVLQLIAAPSLHAAVKAAADREMMTMSEYMRRILIERLCATGFDPRASNITEQSSPTPQLSAAQASAST